MAWIALAGLIGSMASQAAAGQQALASTVEGAETQASIERMGRAHIWDRFKREMENQRPFYEAGRDATDQYQTALTNRLPVERMPLYQMQAGLIGGALQGEDVSEDLAGRVLGKLGAREGEAAKGRLLDLQQIGLGAAGSAGQSAINLGTAFSESVMRGGGALASGVQSSALQRQSMYNRLADQMSGLPSYVAANRKPRNNNYFSQPQTTSTTGLLGEEDLWA